MKKGLTKCRKLAVLFLTFALVLGSLPLTGLRVYADDNDVLKFFKKTEKVKGIDDLDIQWLDTEYDFYAAKSVFSSGLIPVSLETGMWTEKWGYINTKGEVVVDLKYSYANSFREGLAKVRVDNGVSGPDNLSYEGFINSKGELIIPFSKDPELWYENFNNGFAFSNKSYGQGQGMIDKTGREIVPYGEYDEIGKFSEGMAVVKKDDKSGVIDEKGELVVPCIYDSISDYSEGLASVMEYGGMFLPGYSNSAIYYWAFIDKKGKLVIPFKKDGNAHEIITSRGYPKIKFSEGLAAVEIEGCRYINKLGEEVIRVNTFGDGLSLRPFSEGLALVKNYHQKYGFIDQTPVDSIDDINFVIALSDDVKGASDFKNGLSITINDSREYGVIDKTGEFIIPMEYDKIHWHDDKYLIAEKNKRGVVFDNKGKEVAEVAEYEEDLYNHGTGTISQLCDGLYRMNLDKDYIFVDENFKPVIQINKGDDTCSMTKFSEGYALIRKDGKTGIVRNPLYASVEEETTTTEEITTTTEETTTTTEETTTTTEETTTTTEETTTTTEETTTTTEETTTTTEETTTTTEEMTTTVEETTTVDSDDDDDSDDDSDDDDDDVDENDDEDEGNDNSTPVVATSEVKKEVETVKAEQSLYADLNVGDYYYPAIAKLAEKNILKGTGDGKFSPNQTVNRATLVTALYRVAGQPVVENASGFADVKKGSWYDKSTSWAKANNIVNGYSESQFAPLDTLTREQIITELYRYSKAKATKLELDYLATHKDINEVSDYAKEPFAWAIAKGIATPNDIQLLDPKAEITRAELAMMVEKMMK